MFGGSFAGLNRGYYTAMAFQRIGGMLGIGHKRGVDERQDDDHLGEQGHIEVHDAPSRCAAVSG